MAMTVAAMDIGIHKVGSEMEGQAAHRLLERRASRRPPPQQLRRRTLPGNLCQKSLVGQGKCHSVTDPLAAKQCNAVQGCTETQCNAVKGWAVKPSPSYFDSGGLEQTC